jgi:hypothetical protein
VLFYLHQADMISHLKKTHTFREAAADGQDAQSSIPLKLFRSNRFSAVPRGNLMLKKTRTD